MGSWLLLGYFLHRLIIYWSFRLCNFGKMAFFGLHTQLFSAQLHMQRPLVPVAIFGCLFSSQWQWDPCAVCKNTVTKTTGRVTPEVCSITKLNDFCHYSKLTISPITYSELCVAKARISSVFSKHCCCCLNHKQRNSSNCHKILIWAFEVHLYQWYTNSAWVPTSGYARWISSQEFAVVKRLWLNAPSQCNILWYMP